MKAGLRALLIVLITFHSLSACRVAMADTLYRCMGPDGRATWTNQECPAGAAAEEVTVRPVATDSSGLRDWARRNPAARAPHERKTARAREPRHIDSVDCGNARRAYEFELGWKLSRKEQLAYRRREVKRLCGYLP